MFKEEEARLVLVATEGWVKASELKWKGYEGYLAFFRDQVQLLTQARDSQDTINLPAVAKRTQTAMEVNRTMVYFDKCIRGNIMSVCLAIGSTS
jgi:hypothetical protein